MRGPRALALLLAAAGVTLLAVGCGGAAPSTSARVAEAATPTVEAPPAVAPARRPVVVVDPGHAADESGAAAHGVVEKDSNLDMAYRVARVLRTRGVDALLTRTADLRANAPDGSPQPWGYSGTRLDLQGRVDIANAAGADAFVSLHSNGAADPGVRGYEVYYNAARPFAAENRRLARAILEGIGVELRASGYPAMPRAAIDDDCLKAFQGVCFPLFLLGPQRITAREEIYRRGGTPEALGLAPHEPALVGRAMEMPGALAELLFISSPADAALLRDEGAREALARGVAHGVVAYLEGRGIQGRGAGG